MKNENLKLWKIMIFWEKKNRPFLPLLMDDDANHKETFSATIVYI